MTDISRIEKGLYWDRAWSLVEGCTPVSAGCENCWSARQTHMRAKQQNEKIRARYAGLTGEDGRFNGNVQLMTENLDLPLRTRKPTVWAIWNDLFHEDVPDEFVWKVLDVMFEAGGDKHIYLILTKRPERMYKFIRNIEDWDSSEAPHIWLGVTAENQQTADERISILLQIPAAVRFVSVEPMLGPVDLCHLHHNNEVEVDALKGTHGVVRPHSGENTKLDWVICGGESGFGARPMHPDWARNIRDQCQEAGVPFFFKQWGEWLPFSQVRTQEQREAVSKTTKSGKQTYFGARIVAGNNGPVTGTTPGVRPEQVNCVGKKIAGRLLDGRIWDELPEGVI